MTPAGTIPAMTAPTHDVYRVTMEHLQSLRPVALVTTGRTGSCFLQSLLDSHPQVLTFNGELLFYDEFLPNSVCANSDTFAAQDVFDEFVGEYIQRFKSRYDHLERKDQLGPDRAQVLDIDTTEFRRHAVGLISAHEPTTRNLFLATYGAYRMCLGQDLLATTVLFH